MIWRGLIALGVVLLVGVYVLVIDDPGSAGSDRTAAEVSGSTAAPSERTSPPTTSTPATTATTAAAAATTTTTTTTPPTTLPPEPIEVAADPPAHPAPPAPTLPDAWDGAGVVTVAAGGADIADVPGGVPFVRAREGLVLAGQALSTDGAWVRVFHMCDGEAWVRATEIAATPRAPDATVGAGFDFGDAVIIVDPGHGGPANSGAVGPGGLAEKGINVEIGARLRALLAEPHSIDWETGQILRGGDIPAAGLVVVTRSGLGELADYEAGLDFRAAVAGAANAHAMVSIHNNAGWEVPTVIPGVDVYYQSQAPVTTESRRLGTLIVEELRRGFVAFDADWVGASELGAKSRISPRDGVSQYYGVLKASVVPTVIVEGAYISNPGEAELLQTPEFQHAYAAAVYRALVRFITTDEPGDAPSSDPEVWEGFAGRGGARPECEIPSQS